MAKPSRQENERSEFEPLYTHDVCAHDRMKKGNPTLLLRDLERPSLEDVPRDELASRLATLLYDRFRANRGRRRDRRRFVSVSTGQVLIEQGNLSHMELDERPAYELTRSLGSRSDGAVFAPGVGEQGGGLHWHGLVYTDRSEARVRDALSAAGYGRDGSSVRDVESQSRVTVRLRSQLGRVLGYAFARQQLPSGVDDRPVASGSFRRLLEVAVNGDLTSSWCRWCGAPTAQLNAHARFCSANHRQKYSRELDRWALGYLLSVAARYPGDNAQTLGWSLNAMLPEDDADLGSAKMSKLLSRLVENGELEHEIVSDTYTLGDPHRAFSGLRRILAPHKPRGPLQSTRCPAYVHSANSR